jgi:hypothetical protein
MSIHGGIFKVPSEFPVIYRFDGAVVTANSLTPFTVVFERGLAIITFTSPLLDDVVVFNPVTEPMEVLPDVHT